MKAENSSGVLVAVLIPDFSSFSPNESYQ